MIGLLKLFNLFELWTERYSFTLKIMLEASQLGKFFVLNFNFLCIAILAAMAAAKN